MRPRPSHFFALATTLLFALLLYFLRFGYDYGHSDQDEFLPLLFNRLDPQLFSEDWFVTGQQDQLNVRYFFISLLQGISLFFPPWLTVLVVYVMSWGLIMSALFQLSLTFSKQTWIASLVVILALVFTPQWTLGGNDLVHRMLVPSMFAWGLGLWGLSLFLRKKPLLAALLFALATLMQALVGIQLAFCCGLLSFIQQPGGILTTERWYDSLKFGCLYLLLSAPLLVPLFLQQIVPPVPPPDAGPDSFYILASFRAPHHYLFHSFSLLSNLKFFGLFLLASFSMIGVYKKSNPAAFKQLIHLFAILGSLMVSGYILSEIYPVLFFTKLQLFKYSVLAKLLFIILICASLGLLLPERWNTRFENIISSRQLFSIAVFAICVLLIGVSLQWPVFGRKIGPRVHEQVPLSRIEQWVQHETPLDAVFAIPPSFSGFRSRAQRAVVVNFKAYPFQDLAMHVWFRRLTDLAPITLPERGGSQVIPLLDHAFLSLPDTTLSRLSDQYGFEYVLRKDTSSTMKGWEVVFVDAPWTVYQARQEVR